ncbi:uncharacterized protein LOC124542749 [Vanessa cardui]|uniref:uncharacterized protein LOC124542749 n=1 Tax=Vanessa cardui TaxID=171605 RepID=UPI001F129270|nr:uncharacterized protein LOC124542749 [Vanessa cardui]
MLNSLNAVSKEVGLEINLSKTMVMTNGTNIKVSVDNDTLKYTDNYIYLGKQIGFDSKQNEQEVARRTQNTWNKYWSLREIFKTDERWTDRVTKWKGPQGKRLRGRPCLRWEDDIIKIAGPCWPQIAQDREKWTSLEEAFTFT